jgi:hypothetical protein
MKINYAISWGQRGKSVLWFLRVESYTAEGILILDKSFRLKTSMIERDRSNECGRAVSADGSYRACAGEGFDAYQ